MIESAPELQVAPDTLRELRSLLSIQQAGGSWEELQNTLMAVCRLQSKLALRIRSDVQNLETQIGSDPGMHLQILRQSAEGIVKGAAELEQTQSIKTDRTPFLIQVSGQNNYMTALMGSCELLKQRHKSDEILGRIAGIEATATRFINLNSALLHTMGRSAEKPD